jgi:predicted N-acetyltransferase YhbS
MIIREISYASDLYECSKRFREEVLRLPLGLVLSALDLQEEDRQIHIAAVESNETILGTVLLKPLSDEIIKLRQMAVAPALHGRGIGRDLVRFAEQLAIAKGFQTIQMHARMSAKGFYERLGYRSTGTEFIEVTVPTIKMARHIRAAPPDPTRPLRHG